MMIFDRSIVGIVLSNDDKKQAEFLNKFFQKWLEMKKELASYIDKMKESWEKESTIEEDLGYFG